MAKSKGRQECLDIAADALSRFTDSELDEYVKLVYEKARNNKELKGMAAIEQAQIDADDETMKMLFDDMKTKADNVTKTAKGINILKQGKTLRDFFASRYDNYGNTISVFMNAAKNILQRVAYGDLSDEEMTFLRTKTNGIDIARALDGNSADSISQKIAKGILSYMDERTSMTVNSGYLPLEYINDDRQFRHIHNQSKMLAGGRNLLEMAKSKFKVEPDTAKSTWREYIKSQLNLDDTFKHTDAVGLDGEVSDSEVDRILDDIFDNITQGKNDIFSQSKIVNGAEEIKKKRRMFFKFKDWESLLNYNEKYGTGDFYSMLEKDIVGSSSRIGTAELLGSNPHQSYFDMKKAQHEIKPGLGKLWDRNTDLYYQQATGIDQAPVSPTLANFFGNLRSFSSMSALPLIALKSTPDIAYIAAYGARWGMSYMDNYGYLIGNAFNTQKSAERAYIAKLFQGMIHSELGFRGRFADAQNSSEIMQKANMAFYRTVGLNAFDEGNKIGIMHLMAQHLGTMSKREFKGLNEQLQQQLAKHDITENEWNALRQKTEKNLFTIDNVINLSDSELRGIYNNSDKSIPLHQMRTRLFNKIFSIFDIASENAVLQPGNFEKAWLYQGTAPGTIPGELLRSFAQFKAYPLAYIDRVLIGGFKDTKGASARIGWATQMMLAGLPLAVLSNNLSYTAQGLSWPDPSKMSKSELFKYGLDNITFNLGTYLNIANARNQNRNLLSSQLVSPSVGMLSEGIALPLSLVTGHPKQAESAFKDLSGHIVKNFPGGAFMQGMIGQKPHLEAGQHLLGGA